MKIQNPFKHNPNKRNTSPDFVGLDVLQAEHAAQIAQFEAWAAQNKWQKFHDAHYDWWTFPIRAPSSYGLRYSVYEDDVNELKQDNVFMQNYVRGAELLGASWGWDLACADYLTNALPAQTWQNWPIRLHKATTSLQLFGCTRAFESFRKYGVDLILQGHNFDYRGRSLKPLFLPPPVPCHASVADLPRQNERGGVR